MNAILLRIDYIHHLKEESSEIKLLAGCTVMCGVMAFIMRDTKDH